MVLSTRRALPGSARADSLVGSPCRWASEPALTLERLAADRVASSPSSLEPAHAGAVGSAGRDATAATPPPLSAGDATWVRLLLMVRLSSPPLRAPLARRSVMRACMRAVMSGPRRVHP